MAPRFKVIGCELWSDDPAFAAATEHLTISGVCGSGIIEVIGEMYLAGVIDTEGVVRGEKVDSCPHIVADDRTFRYVLHRADAVELSITQNDVRAIQLAKAALRAGIDLLMGHAGVDTLDDMRLAGAFGAHIDPLYALVLGLVPDAPVDAVRSVGNAAGAGAVRALLSMQARAELETAARAVVKIETATEPTFQELFVAAMAFPHATAPSPHLAAVVTLPERTSSVDASGGRRRRRQENRSMSTTETGADHGTEAGTGRRSGGRAGRQALRASHVVEAETYLTRTMKPFEIVSDEGLEIIEHNAETILQEVGVEIRDYPSALQVFADAGATVDGTRVRFPRGMCRQIVQATAPREYIQHARNPLRNVRIGGDATVFAPNYGSPFAYDLDNGRRYATIEDFRNFVKLTYQSSYLHHSGGTVCEPVDIPVSKRHLDMVFTPPALQRQAVHGFGHRGQPCPGFGRPGPHRVRW